jgi:aminopeptidase-like protein
MGLVSDVQLSESASVGAEMHALASELYPVCRSITGLGIRETLLRIQQIIPLELHELPTRKPAFDWTIPKEWNIRDAWIKDATGRRVVDFQSSNLHVVNYSVPVHTRLPLSELRQHLFTIPQHPDWIPYRTSYYEERWGFCLTHNQMLALEEGEYEVCIDSTLQDGHLVWGECCLPGKSGEEVLISVHVCHPSLANDNLSGMTLAVFLARALSRLSNRYTYRFLFIPGTIGAIAWLSVNQDVTRRVRHGLVLSCVGDAGGFHYKQSRRGNAEIDRVMAHLLRHGEESWEVLPFSPYGYDERQYCSPGFNLPVGCLMRSVWGTFPEYHTSADNLAFIRPEQLERALVLCVAAMDVLESNRYFLNLNPYCEPQLGKRGLYRSAGEASGADEVHARLWVLSLSDGTHCLLDIAERSRLPFALICNATADLLHVGLVKEVAPPGPATPISR